MESENHTCDVCRYVDGDNSAKQGFFCRNCNAFICNDCKDRKFRRFLAMCIRWINQDVNL